MNEERIRLYRAMDSVAADMARLDAEPERRDELVESEE